MNHTLDFSEKTKHGIDKLHLMVLFIKIIEGESKEQFEKAMDELKLFLVKELKRELTPQENVDLLFACKEYIMSDVETQKRLDSMAHLFELKFISNNI